MMMATFWHCPVECRACISLLFFLEDKGVRVPR